MFIQEAPQFTDAFAADNLISSFLRMHLSAEEIEFVQADLVKFNQRVMYELPGLAARAESDLPRLVNFGPWGHRIDRLDVSPAWDQLVAVAAEEGLIALGYQNSLTSPPFARLHQMLKSYLFHPVSAFVTCPLAMTDGSAKVIQQFKPESIYERYTQHYLSRDPKNFWLSGQWMTEKSGGSDVAGTETRAVIENGHYRIFGDKWFTSAAASQTALLLARVTGDAEGSKGLSLFALELRQTTGEMDNIVVHRLKDKLGTKAMPTAELTLNGTRAHMLGERTKGVKNISSLLNMTRIYNSFCASSTMARGLNLLKDYSSKRRVFGQWLKDQKLFINTVGQIQARHEAVFCYTFEVIRLLGREEARIASETESQLLRLLVPLLKLYSGKECVQLTSEILEGFGGLGYMEDSGIPKLLRDAQVFPIWEGTTDVLSLDMLRVFAKGEALKVYQEAVTQKLSQMTYPDLKKPAEALQSYLSKVLLQIKLWSQGPEIETMCRDVALKLASLFAVSNYLEYAQFCCQKQLRSEVLTHAKTLVARVLPPTW